ncbi:MAG: FkbM family methyltransferase [Vicinamibacterales bacterium]
METALQQLRQSGFRPAIVIDCGANRGQWFGIASSVFADSEFHLIEAQRECWPALDDAAVRRGRTHVHRTAVTAPGVPRVRMHRGGDDISTGAFVMTSTEPYDADVDAAATTLDVLLAPRVLADDRALLKLDIEGHEIEALKGAAELLERMEVVVSEVRFFDVNHSGRPVFSDVMRFLEARGFALFDFASLSSRLRDQRLWLGDAVFIKHGSPLIADTRRE